MVIKVKDKTIKRRLQRFDKTPKFKIYGIGKNGLKQNSFVYLPMTVKSYFDYIQDNNVNVNPLWQRDDVETNDKGTTKPSKAQGIVGAMFDGLDIGEISIAGDDKLIDMKKYVKEVLEGGHRTRKAIIGFLNNEFPMHKTQRFGEKYFSELPSWAKDYYRNYKLRIIDFYELDEIAKGKQFVQFATQTVLNFVEKANSYGVAISIKGARELTKVIDYGDNVVDNVLPFFKKYCGIKNARSKHLELILQSVGLHFGGNLSTSESEILEYLNTTTQTKITKLENAVKEEYKFYENVGAFWATYTRKKININDFGFLRHLYFSLPKDFKIEDYDLFTKALVNKLNDFETNNADTDYLDENDNRCDSRYAKVWDAFKSYVKKVDSENATIQVRIWLKEITPEVITKDSTRGFPIAMLLKRHEENGGICEVEGTPIHFSQVVGAHIKPHSEGGETEYSNLMITTKFHNTKMGTMNALEYKKMWLANN